MSKYAILYKHVYHEHDSYEPNSNGMRCEVDTYKEFPDRTALQKWIEENDNRNEYSKIKGYRVIEFNDLKVTRTVTLEVS